MDNDPMTDNRDQHEHHETGVLPPETPPHVEQPAPLSPALLFEGKGPDGSRRAFLFKLSLVLNGIVGTVLAIPIVGYLIGPSVKKKKNTDFWVPLGPLSDFPEGETRLVNFRNPSTTPWDGQTGDIPCWVRRVSGTTFQVFAINCAHLGCPVRWFAQSKLFLCPCHGGAYYADGARASGPPERGLFLYEHKIVNNILSISVGDLPNLSNPLAPTKSEQSLIQLTGKGTTAKLAAINSSEPRCSSCQT
jgi:menaquinol-cytochrome c reductase iron-sulfur subunit